MSSSKRAATTESRLGIQGYATSLLSSHQAIQVGGLCPRCAQKQGDEQETHRHGQQEQAGYLHLAPLQRHLSVRLARLAPPVKVSNLTLPTDFLTFLKFYSP